ncbi:hypothetical protein GCM10023189_44630 [Nibrella saemangeumensis]|uniref:Uncharacterized protein n=1 Tax=Nibrella saemangeumensis TaxID=1084526 RepID=A0ABP8NCE4_9BACT
MSESSNNKSLADVTRKNNADKINRFAGSLIPQAPKVTQSVPTTPEQPDRDNNVKSHEPAAVEAAPGTAVPAQARVVEPAAQARKRTLSLSFDDIVSQGPTGPMLYPKTTTISEAHHELLRELSFRYRKPITVIMYNLLDLLDQAYQREKQKGG